MFLPGGCLIVITNYEGCIDDDIASIRDGRAFTSACDATVLKRIFRDNSFVFLSKIENNSIFGISEFLRVSICKFSIFVMVT